MTLGVADDADAPSELFHYRALGHRLGCVIGSFAVHVGSQVSQHAFRRQVVKDDDVIHAFERGHQFRPRFLGQKRPSRALERGNRAVGINGHYQDLSLSPGALQVAHMTHVEQVETSIGQNNSPTFAAQAFAESSQPSAGDDLITHALRIASLSSEAVTVAVPRFITTSPPATLASCAA